MSGLIMVVDDSALVRTQLKRALDAAGFTVINAIDGEDAWKQLEAGAEPKLMICDVNMPRMNGLELLERMAESGRLARISVLMLTTQGQPELIHKARAIGAKAWIIKPFKPDLIVAAAQRLV